MIEKVSRIERVISEKFEKSSMQRIASGLRHYDDLRARSLPVLSRVSARQHIKLPDGINSQQFSANPARCYSELARPRVFNAV